MKMHELRMQRTALYGDGFIARVAVRAAVVLINDVAE